MVYDDFYVLYGDIMRFQEKSTFCLHSFFLRGEGVVVLETRFFVSFGKYRRMTPVCKIIEIFWYHCKAL